MIQRLEAAACQRQPTRPVQGLNMRAATEHEFQKNKYYIQVIKRIYGDTVDSLRLAALAAS